MDQAALVGIRSDWYDRLRDGGGRLLAGLRTGGLDVRAAGWVRSESDREWHLYLVSPAVEAGVSDYWRKYVGLEGAVVGIDRFGESAPFKDLFDYFGFTGDKVASAVKSVLSES